VPMRDIKPVSGARTATGYGLESAALAAEDRGGTTYMEVQ